jgi:5-methylcytosine-specific restriction protein A
MDLGDLMDPDAVLKALDEFDERGREAFLEKYGFRKSRRYFVIYGGREYDSKPIVGAAFGYQDPQRGPVPHTEFDGGENATARRLRQLGFEVTDKGSARNPGWTRDELILAFDIYMRHRGHDVGKNSEAVAELSTLLNRLNKASRFPDPERYRNANSVYMKLGNFKHIDPGYPGAGLRGGGALDREVWRTFADDPERLAKTAAAIKAAIEAEEVPAAPMDVDDEEADMEAPEGRTLTVQHQRRERNRKLVERKKAAALKRTGKLTCEACGFDFANAYGERGAGFIECHHTTPVSELQPNAKTRLADLALVCSNCHRMIHRSQPWLTIEELRTLISKAKWRDRPRALPVLSAER